MKNRFIAVLVLLVACGPATQGTTQQVPVDQAAAFPVTVSGSDGRQLTILEQPTAIVSLSATHTEMLYEIGAGDQVAATDLTANFPAAANDTAKVDAFNFDVEEVAALGPDLVILAFDFSGEVEALGRLDIPTLLLGPAETLEEMLDQIIVVGAVTGRPEEAEALEGDMRDRLNEIVSDARSRGEPLAVFHEVDSTLFSPNSASFLGDIYRRLGFVNIADEVPDDLSAGYVQVSEELIFSADPDVIFLGDAAFGETVDTVSNRPGWSTLSAVRNGAVYELDADIAGRWGPRTVDMVAQIAAAAHEVAVDS